MYLTIQLFHGHFGGSLEKFKLDLKKWKKRHLALAGKVNGIKINILPKFLYLFHFYLFSLCSYETIGLLEYAWNCYKGPNLREVSLYSAITTGLQILGWLSWAVLQRQGISSFKAMNLNAVFASFEDLSRKFGLPRFSLFRYFQVHHLLQIHDPNFLNLSVSGLDRMLEISLNSKGLIARLYDYMASLKNVTLVKIRAHWTAELGEEMNDSDWNGVLQRVNDSTSCIRLSVIQFKILH